MSALGVLTVGPFFVLTYVDDPTTGVLEAGEIPLLRGEADRDVCWSCLRVGRGTSVWLGRICGLRWGLVEVCI